MREMDFFNVSDAFRGMDVGFCTLGTTRRDAGGAAGFRIIDYEFAMHAATIARVHGTREFVVVTSTGANINSLMLYPVRFCV